jgi:hypothetical protein
MFQCFDTRGWREEIHCHVPATAKGGFKLLEHEKYLTVVPSRLISGLNVDWTNLTTVLSGRKE